MTVNVNFKSLIVIALMSGMSSFSAQSAEDSKSLAREATAAEAKRSFWDMPFLEKAYIDTSPADRKDGTVVINKGKWNGEQLVPAPFIAKTTNRIIYADDHDAYGGGKDVSNQGYGYYWWNADLKYRN